MTTIGFFRGEDVFRYYSYPARIKSIRNMFYRTKKKDRLKSASLSRTVYVNPLVAWAKQNNVSLKGVGEVRPI